MSRTRKDAPEARKERVARRFAEREQLFDYQPCAVPVDPWATFDDPGLSAVTRTADALWLGLRDTEPSDAQLLAAPCPHRDADGQPVSCTQADLLARREFTLIAGGQ